MKKRHAGIPVKVGEITIIPLVEQSISYIRKKESLSVYVSRVPIGIAVDSPQGKWAIDIQGYEVPLDIYLQEIPELEDMLSSD